MVADVEVVEVLLSSMIKASNAEIRAVARAKDATETPPKLTPTSEPTPAEAALPLLLTKFS